MGRDRPTQSKDKIGLFVMPKKHSISNGVYLVIKKNYDNQDVGFRFSYSDTSKPMDHITEMMDSFNSKYSTISNISVNNLDDIAKEKINKFIELSNKHNFTSMKSKGGGKWDPEYQNPYKPLPLKAMNNINKLYGSSFLFNKKPKKLIFLLHGYGDSAENFIPLANYLNFSHLEANFFAPNATFPIPQYPLGRQWFNPYPNGTHYNEAGPEEKAIMKHECKESIKQLEKYITY